MIPANRRRHPSATRLFRPVSLAGLIALGLLAGCGEPDIPTVAAPEPAPTGRLLSVPPDRLPPEFGGLLEVRTLGLGAFSLHWEPATDDATPTSDISYQILRSDPQTPVPQEVATVVGQTSYELTLEGEVGTLWVRAIDEAGNIAQVDRGVAPFGEPLWTRIPGGVPDVTLSGCAPTEGGGICVGHGRSELSGYLGLWSNRGWVHLDTSVAGRPSVSSSSNATYLYSDSGALFRVDEEGLERLQGEFRGHEPALPLVSLVADPLGLLYWIDSDGFVSVGDGQHFFAMLNPLALPDVDACPSVRGIGFGAGAGVAVCGGGAVYTASFTDPGLRWLPLTSRAPDDIREGFRGVIADSPSHVVVATDTAVRTAGVGGWHTSLDASTIVDGLDASPTEIRAFTYLDDDVYAVTDVGLFHWTEGWEYLAASEGPLVGVFQTPNVRGGLTLVYEDASVATLQGARHRWVMRPQERHPVLAHTWTETGLVAALEDGVARLDERQWDSIIEGLPTVQLGRLAAHDDRVLLTSTEGELWASADGRWQPATWQVPMPPPEPEPLEPGEVMIPEPPAPLMGMPAPAELQVEPIVSLDIDGDRTIAAGEHQVWRQQADGSWLLVHTFERPIEQILLDSGETYLVWDGTGFERCWRDLCGEDVPQIDAPYPIMVGLVPSTAGWLVKSATGETSRFVQSDAGAPVGSLDPAFDTPAGHFEDHEPDPGPAVDFTQRLFTERYDVGLDDRGTVWLRVEDQWQAQRDMGDALALIPDGESWALLTTDSGLLALAEARIATP